MRSTSFVTSGVSQFYAWTIITAWFPSRRVMEKAKFDIDSGYEGDVSGSSEEDELDFLVCSCLFYSLGCGLSLGTRVLPRGGHANKHQSQLQLCMVNPYTKEFGRKGWSR